MSRNKAVFLDRDGVINDNSIFYYIFKPEQVSLVEGIGQAISELTSADYIIIVISNQGGIAKGLYSDNDVIETNKTISSLVEKSGGVITDFYYCPHHSSLEKCLCAKPNSLMLEKAIAKYDIDIENSYLIGDSIRDKEAGERLGIKSFKIDSNASITNIVSNIILNK